MTSRSFGRRKGLSDAQIALLAEIHNGPTTETECLIRAGRGWRKTAARLEDEGLIRFQPYALKGQGAYRITADGKDRVAALLATGSIVKESTE